MSDILTVALGARSYPIHVGSGLLADAARFLPASGRRVVVSDATVAARYLPTVLAALGLTEDDAFVFPAGEPSKTWATASALLDWLLARRLSRDATLVALGGGVVGDLAGFCAAVYQRGIAFVQMPSTLLAMVDSSVGGKTGVNHARGKNLIGAFHQPAAVLADLDTLRTLPARELAAGAAEVIKYAALGDAAFFAELEAGALAALLALEPATTAAVVRRCCAMKATIVGEDEREAVAGGPRALLNLGHTFGHAAEAHTGYSQWLHGEAVGLGLVMAADLSARLGWLSAADATRLRALVAAAGLPVAAPAGMTPDDFLRLMAGDKKVIGGRLRLVLLQGLGNAVLTAEAPEAALRATLEAFCDGRDATAPSSGAGLASAAEAAAPSATDHHRHAATRA